MFRGFKAQLNILSGKNENSHLSPDLFVTGAYRVNREDAYGFSSLDSDFRPADQIRPTKSTSNLLQPQTSEPKQDPSKLKPVDQSPLRPVKSTSNLAQTQAPKSKLRNSTPVSSDPRGGAQDNRNVALSPKDVKNRENEQKKIDKQRSSEQKKQAKEREKREKLLRETEKKQEKQRLAVQNKQAQEAAKQEKLLQQKAKKQKLGANNKRKNQDLPVRQQSQPEPAPGTSNSRPAYSTNTLESSISRSSGPPPYPDVPKSEPALKDKSNVAFSKPVDNGSWDIISQHRQQMSRPAPAIGAEAKRKQIVMDLNYKFDADTNKDNSEA